MELKQQHENLTKSILDLQTFLQKNSEHNSQVKKQNSADEIMMKGLR